MLSLMLAFMPGTVFWPYFAGIAILAIGLFAIRTQLALASGLEKIVVLGPVFFAIPMAVFASQHFTQTKGVSLIVPAWIPARVFVTYLVGTCLIAAALSIVARKYSQLAAILLATLLILFVLLLHIPNIIANPKTVLIWQFAFRDLTFSGGALAFAGAQRNPSRAAPTSVLITFARIFIAVGAIFFGAVHILHPGSLPAVDLDQLTPAWIPGHALWPYLAGAVYVVAGTFLLLNRKTNLAARCLGFMALLLLLFVYLPLVVSKPSDIDNGLNYFASTLAFSGAALLLASALPRLTDEKTHSPSPLRS